jgi:serine/threonine-protein kinase
MGAVLAGKYRVERVLGQGGMGMVVEALQLDLDRRVALKFLRKSDLPEKSSALTRFEREARTIARLRGEHIVQVYDVGRLEHGEPFIVMELLAGEDLSAVLDREQRLPVATAVDYVLQACEAMAEAHVAGVVHRDLKPANLFLTRRADGRPLIKVLDFGISKLLAETTSLNLTSGVLGSPLYMSPEQLASSKDIDHRTDVWSLGTILYELICGAPAFQAEGLPQVCARIMVGTPDPISKDLRDVPRELEAVLVKCLRRYPDERHLSVADLAAALMPFARKSSLGAAEATIRIVQASSLPHGPLPRLMDSLPPGFDATQLSPGIANDKTVFSGPPESVLREYPRPESGGARTVNVSGAPPAAPAGATHAELKPLVSLTSYEPPRTSLVPRPLIWAALALLAMLALLATLQVARRGDDAAAAVTAEPAPAAPTATPAPTPRLAAEPASPPQPPPIVGSAPAVPAAAPPPADVAPRATPPTKRRPAPAKAREKPAADDEAEQLLNHR